MDYKRVKCKDLYGKWFYRKTTIVDWEEGTKEIVYSLYDEFYEFESSFKSYNEMMYYIYTGGYNL